MGEPTCDEECDKACEAGGRMLFFIGGPTGGKWSGIPNNTSRRLAETADLLFEARLASEPVARRLGAIPLAHDPSASATLPIQPEMVSGPTTDSLPVVGMVSSALCLAGCLVKRFYGQLKARVRRDSFGFLPDSRRPSLTKADLAV